MVSNAGFLIVGMALIIYSLRQRRPLPLQVMSLLLFLVGVGSLAFHLFATLWAQWLDVLFIALFIYSFVPVFLRLRYHLPVWLVLLVVPAYHLFGMAMTSAFRPGAYHGSVAYFPAYLTLIVVGLLCCFGSARAGAKYLFAATLVFSVSLFLRTHDLAWCERWERGTHWLWHLLNAVTLGLTWYGLNLSIRPFNPART